MTLNGPGYMCKIDGTLNQDFYIKILEDELKQTIDYYDIDSAKMIFQQDNASCHRGSRAREWFRSQEFDVMV